LIIFLVLILPARRLPDSESKNQSNKEAGDAKGQKRIPPPD